MRSAEWARHIVREEAASYFPLITFATCSPNVALTAQARETDYLDVATRQRGLISAVALTSELSPVHGDRYFFQVKVEALAEKRSNKTLALGFVWPLPHALLLDSDEAPQMRRRASHWTSDGHMPELAYQLPRSFVVGGDPPKAYMGGKELAKITWRPLLECTVGTVLGLVLDVGPSTLSLTVYQDGEEKCKVEGPLNEDWRWPSLGAPNGVVDVCGAVSSISLCQGAQPPDPPLAVTAGEDEAEESKKRSQIPVHVPS